MSICKWYILRNVRTEARSIFNDKESQDYAVAKITALFDNSTKDEIAQKYMSLKSNLQIIPSGLIISNIAKFIALLDE